MKQIPPRVIAEMLGIDPEMANEFAEWVQGVLELGLTDPANCEKYRAIIEAFFRDEIGAGVAPSQATTSSRSCSRPKSMGSQSRCMWSEATSP
ncbi:MAG: hypothetical protein R2706_08270 [Acidimicrobiales bacterium]